jgi:hypothetical protein
MLESNQRLPRPLPSLLLVLLSSCPLVFLLSGCGKPYKVAPVSGKITLDGKPLAKATVSFVPLGTKENQAPGPTSHGGTDAEGRFSLSLSVTPPTPGSVVGKCRVFITTLQSDPAADDRDAGGPVRRVKDKVPEKYNLRTELVFDVPAAGTDQANFDLTSR